MKTRHMVVATVAVVGCSGVPSDESGSGGGTHAASGGGGGAPSGGGAGGGNATGGGGGTAGGWGSGGGTHAASGGGSGGAGSGAQARRDDLYTAGTRLKVRSLVGTDGSRQQVSLWDSQRNEACNFLLAGDGKIRCLPGFATGAYRVAGFNRYVDAVCSVLAFMPATCGTPTKYGVDYASTCPTRFELHSLDPAPLSTVYSLSGTTCIQAQIPAGAYFFKSTGIIDPTTFVEASYVIDP